MYCRITHALLLSGKIQDEAFANIAQKISEVVESLRESKIELLRSQPQIDKQEQQPTNSSYRSPTPLRLDEATIQEIRERCRQKNHETA